MSKEININSPWPTIRGAQILCETCRTEGDPLLWQVLMLATREPGKRLTRGQETLLDSTADFHEEQHPGHKVHRFNLKKF